MKNEIDDQKYASELKNEMKIFKREGGVYNSLTLLDKRWRI